MFFQAIAAKLKAKNAKLRVSGGKLRSAAQVLAGEVDITDQEIDDILGVSGVDEGLSDSDILGLDDPSILSLDDPNILDLDDDALLFDDYEYDDYEEDDYDEIIYDYEYEEEEEPEVIVEYEYEDEEPEIIVEYEYEEEPPRPAYKPRYQPAPRYRPKPAYPQYRTRHPAPAPAPALHSGPQFLSKVTGLLQAAERAPPHVTLSGSLRSALLGEAAHQHSAELSRGPGGRVSSQASRGSPGPPRSLHPQVHIPARPHSSAPATRHALRHAPGVGLRGGFSGLVAGGAPGTRPSPPSSGRGATFSQIMGDLLQGKPRIPGVAG